MAYPRPKNKQSTEVAETFEKFVYNSESKLDKNQSERRKVYFNKTFQDFLQELMVKCTLPRTILKTSFRML